MPHILCRVGKKNPGQDRFSAGVATGCTGEVDFISGAIEEEGKRNRVKIISAKS